MLIVTLVELNAARAANGKAPLKSWKASKQALADAWAKERHAAGNFEMSTEELAAQADRPKHEEEAPKLQYAEPIVGYKKPSTRLKEEAAMHADPRPTKEIMAERKAKASVSNPSQDPFNLADVARYLKIDPKAARIKARRHLRHLQINKTEWTFKAKDYNAVVSILTNDQRKK